MRTEVSSTTRTLYLAFGLPVVAFLTLCVHLIGSVVLVAVAEGAEWVHAAPVVAVFGFVWLPVEFVLISAQWLLFAAFSFSSRAYRWLLVVSVLVIPTMMALFAGKEIGNEFRWGLGYWVGAAASGAFSLAALGFYVNVIKGFKGESNA
jgi:hypothetical protein